MKCVSAVLVLTVWCSYALGESCERDDVLALISELPWTDSYSIKLQRLDSMLNQYSGQEECSQYIRFILLPSAIRYSAFSEDYDRLMLYAQELERLAYNYAGDWNYGNAVHDLHLAKGLIAVDNDDPSLAVEHLSLSIDVPASPQINAYGTSTLLAKRLLDEGFKEEV